MPVSPYSRSNEMSAGDVIDESSYSPEARQQMVAGAQNIRAEKKAARKQKKVQREAAARSLAQAKASRNKGSGKPSGSSNKPTTLTKPSPAGGPMGMIAPPTNYSIPFRPSGVGPMGVISPQYIGPMGPAGRR